MNNARSQNSAVPDLILRPADGGEDIPLSGELRIGREKDCEICIDDQRISRYHARLRVTPAGIILEDLHSTNGTYVNGRQIWGAHSVSLGDELRFHERAYRLVSDKSEDRDLTLFVLPTAQPKPGSAAAGAVPDAGPGARYAALGPADAERSPTRPPVAAVAARRVDLGATQVQAPVPSRAVASAPPPAAGRPPGPARAAPPKPRDRPSAIERQESRLREKEAPYLERLEQLSRGSWLELLDDGGRRLACCKLTSGAAPVQHFYFLSRAGFGRLELSSMLIAQQFEQGRARILDRGPWLGRVLVRLSGALRSGAGEAGGNQG